MGPKEFSPIYLAPILLLPLLGIVSSYYDNRLLLIATFLIAALTVFSMIGKSEERMGKIYEKYMIMLIFSVSLTLLMSQSISSSFLQGGDIHQEYYDFSQVLAAGVWHPTHEAYSSVLSITVLPTVLKIVSGFDGVVIFTMVYPLIFSIAPVLLYKLCRTFLASAESFLASFLFLAYRGFYFVLISDARQEIAEIFLLLLLLLLVSPKVTRKPAGVVLIFMLTVGIDTAHYSIAYIYILLLVLWYLTGRACPRMKKSVPSGIVALTVVITALWYVFLTSGVDIVNLVNFVSSINLAGFFNPTSRPLEVNTFLGIGALPGPLHILSRMTYYLVNATLGLGFLVVLFKRKNDDAERKMLPLLAFGVFLIGASVLVPNFGFGLNFSREYQIGLLFASPCFVYGIIFLNSKIRELFSALSHASLRVPATRSATNWRLSAATLLFLFFLFDSGWIYAVSLDNPTSVLLDSARMKLNPAGAVLFYGEYTSSKDVAAARWLTPQLGSESSLCADSWTRSNVLTSYGGLGRYASNPHTYYLPEYECDFRDGYVFLSDFNTVYGIGISAGADIGTGASQAITNSTWPIAQISSELNSDNLIYSNGGTTIYNYPG